jgi:hypothetical protein
MKAVKDKRTLFTSFLQAEEREGGREGGEGEREGSKSAGRKKKLEKLLSSF